MNRTTRNFAFFAALLSSVLLAPQAQAVVETKLKLNHKSFVIHSPVELEFTMRNPSRRVFNFQEAGPNASERARLRFILKDSSGRDVNRTKAPLLDDLFIITPQDQVTRKFDLTALFDIRKISNYSLQIRLYIDDRVFKTEEVRFETVAGSSLNKIRTFEPAREFELLRTARVDGQYLFLAVRGIDAPPNQTVFGVYELGRMVQAFSPAMETDLRGNIHILHSLRPDRYLHTMFTASGRPIDQNLHMAEIGGASLVADENGVVRVSGTRRMSPEEVGGGRRRP